MTVRRRVLAIMVFALALSGSAGLSACSDGSSPNHGPATLSVVAPDSFTLSKDFIRAFERDNDAQVRVIPSGDVDTMINASVRPNGHVRGDVMVGVDNTNVTRAFDAGLFLPYSSPLLSRVPNALQADASNLVTPIDYGYVNLNYDVAELARLKLSPPTRLEDLTGPQWTGKVVVENPATSSTGLAFLVATISYFGPDKYLDWWRQMRANGILVAGDWLSAYTADFSLHDGQRPVVLGYASSAPFEQMFAERERVDSPVGNILPSKGVFRQIEYAGILKTTQNEKLARKFIDFLLSPAVQEDMPIQMAVYPVNIDAKLPEAFEKFGMVNVPTADISVPDIARGRAKWIADWTKVVIE